MLSTQFQPFFLLGNSQQKYKLRRPLSDKIGGNQISLDLGVYIPTYPSHFTSIQIVSGKDLATFPLVIYFSFLFVFGLHIPTKKKKKGVEGF
jgi:hypothetical protein